MGHALSKTLAELDLPQSIISERQQRTSRVLRGEIVRRDISENYDSGPRHFHVLEAPIKRDGHVMGSLGIKIDLTPQRRAEESLRDSQRRISRHLENTPLGVVDFDADFRIQSWHAAAEAIFGWQAQQAIERLGNMIILPKHRADIAAVWKKLMADTTSSRHFNQNITKDARPIDCEWYNTSITDTNGVIVGVSSLVLDVTDRLAAEHLFRESEERFQKISHLSPTPQQIIALPDGHIIDVNQSWLDTYGYERTDLELRR
ncbi:MAG: PAS domain S-box protein [Candidatus Synoicihabitans palmerolidicus]|nr:PAS domain S-box protein [Candidatus Synoicihabitans palmerolidicus]